MNKNFLVISSVIIVALAYGYYFNRASKVDLPSVNATIAAMKAELMSAAPAEMKNIMSDFMRELESQHMEESFLQVGDKAPDFTLKNTFNDKDINLYKILKKHNVVLTFYRGGWCPYCNIALRSLQLALPEILRRDTVLIAISPEQPNKTLSTQEKNQLQFNILSDTHNKVAREYNLVFKLNDQMLKLMRMNGMDLYEYNADSSGELPVPATYVIDKSGTIQYAFADIDYSKRAEPSDIIAVLDNVINYKAVIER